MCVDRGMGPEQPFQRESNLNMTSPNYSSSPHRIEYCRLSVDEALSFFAIWILT